MAKLWSEVVKKKKKNQTMRLRGIQRRRVSFIIVVTRGVRSEVSIPGSYSRLSAIHEASFLSTSALNGEKKRSRRDFFFFLISLLECLRAVMLPRLHLGRVVVINVGVQQTHEALTRMMADN